MGDPEHDAATRGEAPERTAESSRRFLERPLGIVSLIAGVVGILTGIVGLVITLGGSGGDGRSDADVNQTAEIQEFEGVAGHLAESRAILSFLDQHDGDVVYLDVGFPAIVGPASGDNLVVERISNEDGTTSDEIQQIDLMTDCGTSGVNSAENPTVGDGCTGSALSIGQPQNSDAQTFFEHGVPRVKGYFRVDVTGGLYQGLRPIGLEPLTFDEISAE
jgi:hypothetical protein